MSAAGQRGGVALRGTSGVWQPRRSQGGGGRRWSVGGPRGVRGQPWGTLRWVFSPMAHRHQEADLQYVLQTCCYFVESLVSVTYTSVSLCVMALSNDHHSVASTTEIT